MGYVAQRTMPVLLGRRQILQTQHQIIYGAALGLVVGQRHHVPWLYQLMACADQQIMLVQPGRRQILQTQHQIIYGAALGLVAGQRHRVPWQFLSTGHVALHPKIIRLQKFFLKGCIVQVEHPVLLRLLIRHLLLPAPGYVREVMVEQMQIVLQRVMRWQMLRQWQE